MDNDELEGDSATEFNIPLLVYWRASVCLEFFYSLFCDRREIFYSLHLMADTKGENDFFNLVTAAAADFATASASCKRGISSVARFCESDAFKNTPNSGMTRENESKRNMFLDHLGDFAIHRIYPTIISKSRDLLKVRLTAVFPFVHPFVALSLFLKCVLYSF